MGPSVRETDVDDLEYRLHKLGIEYGEDPYGAIEREVLNLRADVEVFRSQRDAAQARVEALRVECERSIATRTDAMATAQRLQAQLSLSRQALKYLADEVSRWTTPLAATKYALHSAVAEKLRRIGHLRAAQTAGDDEAGRRVATELELVAQDIERLGEPSMKSAGPAPLSMEDTLGVLEQLLGPAKATMALCDSQESWRAARDGATCEAKDAGYDNETIYRFLVDEDLVDWLRLSPAEQAENTLVRFGGFDQAHHKAWAIDQALRCLMSPQRYLNARRQWADEGYEYEEGTAP